MLYKIVCQTPLGYIQVVSDGEAVVSLYIEGSTVLDRSLFDGAYETYEHPALNEIYKWIYDYFGGRRPSLEKIKLCPEGSDFKRTVWSVVSEIPYGEVISYNDVCVRVGERLSKRSIPINAVRSAIAVNPIPILIPCHRVVSKEGELFDYVAPISKKAQLLRLECARSTFCVSGIKVLEKRIF